MLDLWRRHFVVEEQMLELECTTLMPHAVLKASGHVDRFTDLMVKDTKTGECYRADKLLEQCMERLAEAKETTTAQREEYAKIAIQAGAYSPSDLWAKFQEFGITAPASGNPLTEPFPFNLMFSTPIGPEGNIQGYLRPETAQGMFINFRRLLDYNQNRMPFAAAQIGLAFRNEIAPRNGLLRVREFTMAEIEHFVKPDAKDHPKFKSVADRCLGLFPRARQLGDGKVERAMPLSTAVSSGVINNETLAYFMARVESFLVSVGISRTRLRFRQHLPTEMAHYASDCWDAEIHTSFGWVECVGIADRSCYDLKVHAERARVELVASHKLEEPRVFEAPKLELNQKLLGVSFKGEKSAVVAALEVRAVKGSGGEGRGLRYCYRVLGTPYPRALTHPLLRSAPPTLPDTTPPLARGPQRAWTSPLRSPWKRCWPATTRTRWWSTARPSASRGRWCPK